MAGSSTWMSSTACLVAMAAISFGVGISRRIEGELERAFGPRPDRDALDVELGGGTGEVDMEPPFGQNAGAQARERAVGEQASLADDDDALGQRLDVVHVVRRQQHGHALLAVEPPHELAHGELRGRIEADGRLVEEQDRGIVQQGGGELRPHALAERELAHRLGQQPLEPQHGHELVASAAIVRRRHAVDVGQQIEAVDHRQVPPELAALAEHHADARDMAHAVLVRHEAADLDPAARRPQDAGQDLDGRRLAGAVGADEGQQLAGLETERDIDQGVDLAPTPAHEAAQRAGQARRAFGNAIGLGQRLDEDLGHGAGPPVGRKGRGTYAAAVAGSSIHADRSNSFVREWTYVPSCQRSSGSTSSALIGLLGRPRFNRAPGRRS